MPIIKLDATDSTNDYLKQLATSQPLQDYTVVSTELQRKGRGQRGADWASDKGKNLTFSVLKNFVGFEVKNQFDINCIVSLAVYSALQELSVPDLSVKWPNDIMSANKKICGILIENILQGNKIQFSILGIGLNINQTEFGSLVNASSLKLVLKRHINLDELLHKILSQLKLHFSLPKEQLQKVYDSKLFRKDLLSEFKHAGDKSFKGYIRGVNQSGLLIIETLNNDLLEFDLKQVSLCY